MAASTKTLSPGKTNSLEEWTIVLPRRGKQRRNFGKSIVPQQKQPWVPIDDVIDPHIEAKLMQKIKVCLKKIETSNFFSSLMDQVQSQDIVDSVYRVLGSEQKMQMVIYGIGSLESYEPPRMQLSLALLLQKHCSWIGDLEVFDPVLSATETRLLETLGCSVLSVNEHGRRKALKPTLFYMPHCEAELYDNLLQANWKVDMLKNIVLLGNSFKAYKHFLSVSKDPKLASRKNLLAVETFTQEFKMDMVNDDYYRPFHDSSWHFFSPVSEVELQSLEDVIL